MGILGPDKRKETYSCFFDLLGKVPCGNGARDGHVLARDDELRDPEDAKDVDEEGGDGDPAGEEGVGDEAALGVFLRVADREQDQEGDGPQQAGHHQGHKGL